jgi:uncharacterized repeat protein (TIGR03803 family)
VGSRPPSRSPRKRTINGTVFTVGPDGTFTVVYSFTGGDDGGGPSGTLILASDGNFYGTTEVHGVLADCGYAGCLTIFKMTPAGVLTTLYSFDSTDGSLPHGGLVQGTNGDFYGTPRVAGPMVSERSISFPPELTPYDDSIISAPRGSVTQFERACSDDEIGKR